MDQRLNHLKHLTCIQNNKDIDFSFESGPKHEHERKEGRVRKNMKGTYPPCLEVIYKKRKHIHKPDQNFLIWFTPIATAMDIADCSVHMKDALLGC